MRLFAAIAAIAILLTAAPASAATFECTCTIAASGTDCSSTKVFRTGFTQESDAKPQPSKECQDKCEGQGEICSVGWDDAAASPNAGPPADTRVVKLQNPLGTASVPQLVGNIIKAFVGVVGAFALLTFIYGGFLLLTSAGEAGKIQSGKDAMKWSVIGLVVVFSSYALVSFVLSSLQK